MVGKAAFAVLGLTTLAAFSSGEEVIDDLPICVVAAEWVQDNPEALPTTLEGFADFSIPYRRAIANAMEPEVRSSIWIEQLTEFRDGYELSVDQEKFVNSLVGLVSEGLFARGDEGRAEMRELVEPGKLLFEKQVLTTTFSILAPIDMEMILREDCECSSYGWGCPAIGISCTAGADNCRGVEQCGVLGFDYCDGLCTLNPSEE
jgi:hypothetical protein